MELTGIAHCLQTVKLSTSSLFTMPRLTNNSLSGFNLREPNSLDSSLLPPVSLPSTVGRSSESNVGVSLVDISTSSSTAVTSVIEAFVFLLPWWFLHRSVPSPALWFRRLLWCLSAIAYRRRPLRPLLSHFLT